MTMSTPNSPELNALDWCICDPSMNLPCMDATTFDEVAPVIPPKYNDQSELACTVRSGSNQQDFDLEMDSAEWPPVRFWVEHAVR
jgi:hypothetical protein